MPLDTSKPLRLSHKCEWAGLFFVSVRQIIIGDASSVLGLVLWISMITTPFRTLVHAAVATITMTLTIRKTKIHQAPTMFCSLWMQTPITLESLSFSVLSYVSLFLWLVSCCGSAPGAVATKKKRVMSNCADDHRL